MNGRAEPEGAWRVEGIPQLVRLLRDDGFSVGASEAADATRLVMDLARREPAGADPARICTRLRPIFCKTREEQERFDAVFDRWVSARTSARLPTFLESQRAAATTPLARGMPSLRVWWQLAAVLVVGLAIAYAWRSSSRAPTPSAVNAPSAGPSAPRVTPETPGAASVVRQSIDGFVPAVRYNRELRAIWIWVGLALPLIGFFGVSLPALILSRTRYRGNSAPMFLDSRPLEIEARRLVPEMRQDLVDRLARHVRSTGLDMERLARRPVLDIRGTIEATIRNNGIPSLKFSHSRVHPSYLLLVDVANERDPRGRLFFQWAERMQREKLEIEILLIRAVTDTNASTTVLVSPPGVPGRDATKWVPLNHLRAPAAVGERLIVVSDGDPLVDAQGNWRQPALRARFYRWADRVVFTPVEPRDWSAREEAIERKERAADPGFIVLPLDESALSAWTDLVLTGRLSTVELSDPQRFPAGLRGGRADEYFSDDPPASERIESLVAQLHVYLGRVGFQWLSACAVPPLVRWELTLLLGQDVVRDVSQPRSERDAHATLARHYRRLVRLPWMQRETMPQWLRLRLLAELPAKRHSEIQELVRTRLGALSPTETTDGIELAFERPPGAGGRHPDRDAAEVPVTAGPRQRTFGDPLYLGYLSGLTPEQLVLRVPPEWSRWIRNVRLPHPRGMRGRIAKLRDRVSTLWARLAWRDGLPHLGFSARTLVASALLLVPLAALAIAAAQSARLRDVVMADNWLLVERPRLHAWQATDSTSMTVNRDGIVATGHEDGTIRLWDSQSGAQVAGPFRGHTRPVRSVAFSPGTQLVSGSDDTTLRRWDMRTGTMVGEPLRGHLSGVTSVAFSHDGAHIASGSEDGTARLWDARTGVLQRTMAADIFAVSGVAFSPDAARLVSFGTDQLRLWNLTTGEDVSPAEMRAAPEFVHSVAFSPDGRLLAAGGDRLVRLWDAQTGQIVGQPIAGHQDSVRSVAFSADGARLVSAGDDQTIRVWDVAARVPIGRPAHGHDAPVTSALFSPDGNRLFSGSTDGTIRVWDAQPGTRVGDPLRDETGLVRAIAFSPDGQRLATAVNATIRLWDLRAGGLIDRTVRELLVIEAANLEGGSVSSMSFSPDSRRLVAGSDDGTLGLWDVATGTPSGIPMRGHSGSVATVAFSPDGGTIASGSSDTTVRLWDATTASAVGQPLTGHPETVRSVAFSPDGKRLASGGFNPTVRLWDVERREPIGGALSGHRQGPISVAFSADSSTLYSVAGDLAVRRWDANTGAPEQSVLDVQSVEEVINEEIRRSPAISLVLRGTVVADKSPVPGARVMASLVLPTPTDCAAPQCASTVTDSNGAFRLDLAQLSAQVGDDVLVTTSAPGFDLSMRRVRIGPEMLAADPPAQPRGLQVRLDGSQDRPPTTVQNLVFSPDASRILSASEETIRLSGLDGTPLGSPLVTGARARMSTLAFSHDGRYVAAAQDPRAPSDFRLAPSATQLQQMAAQYATERNVQLWRVTPWPPPNAETSPITLGTTLGLWWFGSRPLDIRGLYLATFVILAGIAVTTLRVATHWRRTRAVARQIRTRPLT